MRVPLLDYARTSATSAFPSRDVTDELLSGVFTARCKLHLLCTARSGARAGRSRILQLDEQTARGCETFPTPPLMSKKTIHSYVALRHCSRAAVEQKFNTKRSAKNAKFTS